MMALLFSLLAALALALGSYFLLAALFSLRPSPSKHLQAFRPATHTSQWDSLTQKTLANSPEALAHWEAHVRWLARAGVQTSLGQVGRQALALGLTAGLVPLFLNASPFMWMAPLGGFFLPWINLRAQANRVRLQAQRNIPDLATLMAAELTIGTPPQDAVTRACALPGPLSALLNEALAHSQQTGRPLFSRNPVRGTLFETLARTNIPALRAFAVQLDLVAAKGTAGARMMQDLARTLGREYHEQVVANVEKLDSQLTLGVTVFYFAPMILLILGSFFAAILEVF